MRKSSSPLRIAPGQAEARSSGRQAPCSRGPRTRAHGRVPAWSARPKSQTALVAARLQGPESPVSSRHTSSGVPKTLGPIRTWHGFADLPNVVLNDSGCCLGGSLIVTSRSLTLAHQVLHVVSSSIEFSCYFVIIVFVSACIFLIVLVSACLFLIIRPLLPDEPKLILTPLFSEVARNTLCVPVHATWTPHCSKKSVLISTPTVGKPTHRSSGLLK